MKIVKVTAIRDLNGKPVDHPTSGILTIKQVLMDSVNAPPHILGNPDNKNPRHLAELRGSILTKLADESETFEFLPEEVDEGLQCVATVQPSTLYLSAKAILNTAPKLASAAKNK